ncbi:MAG: hypothetical protein KO206_04455 [Methanomicrobiaceae archaeon]|uniref:Uncharacterized protein n=1 Tax=hydrocarbon metagenome TaxID=938273 RepID=A0A0W8FI43_9ZZZZ|nr:hypothetical protein [Methanomicrobiaceae archaeon]MDD5418702.1 hypothetical protein [Methanomicrobiaceae archaeon]
MVRHDIAIAEIIVQRLERLMDSVEYIELYRATGTAGGAVPRQALYREFCEAAGAMAEASALARMRMRSPAAGNAANIDFLVAKGVLDRRTGSRLKEADRLAQRLAAGQGCDAEDAALFRLAGSLRDFSAAVLAWLVR